MLRRCCDDLVNAIAAHLFPSDLLSLSVTCRRLHALVSPDTKPPILLTDTHSHTIFPHTPRGYIAFRWPYARVRTDDYKRSIIRAVVDSTKPLDEADVCVLVAALADEEEPRTIPWRFLWYQDKRLLKYAALRCCVPLFEKVQRAITSQIDSNMIQLLLVSSIHDGNTQDFVRVMRMQRFDVVEWVVEIADRYGYTEVVAELQRLKRQRRK